MKRITPRELLLLSIGALLSVAATEVVALIKNGTLINALINFPSTSASIKLLSTSIIMFIPMLLLYVIGYHNIFRFTNLTRSGTAALGISLTLHAFLSGNKFEFFEGLILSAIVISLSFYSLLEVYTSLKISPNSRKYSSYCGESNHLDANSLRAYLDSSKVSYENLTGELRKCGIRFKQRDLTSDDQFVEAVKNLATSGISTKDQLDDALTRANSHVDKIQFMLSSDQNDLVMQPSLISVVADLYRKKLI